jgi:hypothetical protein
MGKGWVPFSKVGTFLLASFLGKIGTSPLKIWGFIVTVKKKGIIGIINEEIGKSWDDLGYSYREHLMETPYIWEL